MLGRTFPAATRRTNHTHSLPVQTTVHSLSSWLTIYKVTTSQARSIVYASTPGGDQADASPIIYLEIYAMGKSFSIFNLFCSAFIWSRLTRVKFLGLKMHKKIWWPGCPDHMGEITENVSRRLWMR